MKAHSVFNILLLAAASLAHNITSQTGKRHEKCRRAPHQFSSPRRSRPSPQPQPSSSPSPNPHTKPPPPPWPPLRHNPTPSSSRVRDHEGHEHSSPPVNPATSVIKHNPKIIDLTTNTKYSKHHSRHKIHLNQISRTLTIEAACRRPGRYLPACLHVIGNEPYLTILPIPTSSSTMTESPKNPVVTVSKVFTAHIVSLVVVTLPVAGPKVVSTSV
ncbi:hypothetical protein E4U27_001629 [Claviceps purpurea]|nr:hypothetical protein E4U27_001629 [Claviceps purpurea]